MTPTPATPPLSSDPKPLRQDTIFAQWVLPWVQKMGGDRPFREVYERVDWDTRLAALCDRDLTYPDYYQNENFHGIAGGYLNINAAISYDPITQFAVPPHEGWVRQGLIDALRLQPRRILDLGCGTGSTTVLLKQQFPQAEVIGLDLSPYMLAVAADKADRQGLKIQWCHGDAAATGYPADHFDLVTASLLFHETPAAIAPALLREAHRILAPGGEVAILDGCQAHLRQAPWILDIFEEPYAHEYVQGNLDAWLGAAGFTAVITQPHWWLHQLSQGRKP